MSKYDYLKKYINLKTSETGKNAFYQVTQDQIKCAEQKIGADFPSELKEFWSKVGYGFFESSSPEVGITQKYYSNRFVHPDDIVSILTEGDQSELITEEGLELLQEGDIPFFEVEGFTSYLTMKPNSENSNAVYDVDGSMIEDSLEKFIWKLYHVSPTYYLEKK